MNDRRRRANDFTDSLTSFRKTSIQEHNSQNVQSNSAENLDNDSTKSRPLENNNHHSKKNSRTGSIILAGHLASECSISLLDSDENACKDKQQALSKDINISDETSYLSSKPDLNKCINLFHNDCLSKENYTSGELLSSGVTEIDKNINALYLNKSKTVEIQCYLIKDYPRSLSLNSIKTTNCQYNEIKKSKSCVSFNDNLNKDTNSDIKTEEIPSSANEEATVKTNNQEKLQSVIFSKETSSSSKPSTLLKKKTDTHFTREDKTRDSISSEISSKEFNPSELKALLNSLGDQRLWKQEEVTQKRLFRRLSVNFYDSPRSFTEKLLTILEESVINSDTCEPIEYPDISLCRLTQELRKMCKFIEDETIPEWPRSPNMLTPNGRKSSKSECRESCIDATQKSLGIVATPDKDLYTDTPIQIRRNVKSPRKLHKHMPKISIQSPKLHDSTSTFESLEAFCKVLYPNEYRTPPGEKNWSQSPIQEMKHILLTCRSQMASLENSPNIRGQIREVVISTVDSVSKSDTVPETQDSPCKLSREKRDTGLSISDVLKYKQQTESNNCHAMIDPDDLESTLMYELAKKRQRCLDTAKVMLKIDSETSSESVPSGAAEVQCPYLSNAIGESNINDSKFMETLMTVKNYQNYLEGYKSLINKIQQVGSNGSRSSCGEKDMQEANKDYLEIPKSSTTSKKITNPSAKHCSPKVVNSKPKLFVTPGKTPVKRACNSKRTYFPNLITGANKQKRDISPHEKNVYRQMGSYDHVISPVGMYIRSTNPSLMKNLRPKTDDMLLTPKKQQIPASSPSLKPEMKFRLSPRELATEMTKHKVKDENVADNFLHPKVHYKLPSHVRTVKQAESRKVGNRINELLRTTQDKVVIRHESRVKSIRSDLEQPEIHYTSAEESVHIEQTARKTHFSRT